MKNKIKEILFSFGIDTVGFVDFVDCRVTMERRLAHIPENTKGVITLALPYYTKERGNVSRYAAPRDYHFLVKTLKPEIEGRLSSAFEGESFTLLADTSPIDERDAAAKSGIGIIGENMMLITEKYSTFVFLAEIFTTLDLSSPAGEIKYCEGCGKCRAACPMENECLSAITQKKGTLSKKEADMIRESGCIWGCDICQEVCPYAENASETPIDFFKTDLTPYLTKEILDSMDDREFSERAYSWRGRKTIERNIRIMKNTKVLFIGNSYTYFSDMPKIFEALARENGFLCTALSVTRGGWWLIGHASPEDESGKTVHETLENEENIDFAVLQDNSLAAVNGKEDFFEGVRILSEKLSDKGIKPVLYQTWARAAGSETLTKLGITREEMHSVIKEAYESAAEKNGAINAPVGNAFFSLQGKDGIDLYDPDKSHPSYAGSYLAAAVIFRKIFACDPKYPLPEAVEKLGEDTERLIREESIKY